MGADIKIDIETMSLQDIYNITGDPLHGMTQEEYDQHLQDIDDDMSRR